jgi:hypothetical protein
MHLRSCVLDLSVVHCVARSVLRLHHHPLRSAMAANAKAPPVPPAGFRYILVKDDILDEDNLKISNGPFSNRKVAKTICDFQDLTTLDEEIDFIVCLSMKSPGLLLAMRHEQYLRVLGSRAMLAKSKAKAHAIIGKAMQALPPPPKAVVPPWMQVAPPVAKALLALMPPQAVPVVAPPVAKALLVFMPPQAVPVVAPPVAKALLALMPPPPVSGCRIG